MHYVACGAGAPVVLLHGFPDFWYSWRHQLPVLCAAHLRCIAPDLRGYNETAKPAGVASYRIEALVADVVALIRRTTGGNVFLVGHDWGGVLGWRLAAQHPELVRKLVVINAPHPGVLRRELRRPRQLLRFWYAGAFQLPLLPELALSSLHYRLLTAGAARTEQERERYEEALSQPGALTAALNYYRAAFRALLAPARPHRLRVTMPTLVLWGERDAALGPHLLDGLERYVEQLEIVRFADVGHWVHIDAAARVNDELLRFLT